MLKPRKLSATRKATLTLAAIVLIVVISYLVYTNFLADKIEIIKPLKVKVDTLVMPKIDPKVNGDFLSQSPYQQLKMEVALPVTVQGSELGRPNPFRKIPFYFNEEAAQPQ